MARRKDPATGKLLPDGIYPVVSERTGAVTYRARATYSAGGKRRHMSKTHKTARVAIAWKLDIDTRLHRGQVAEPDTITVDQYFAQWLERQRPNWSGSKCLLAEAFWRIHAEPVLGGMRMQDVKRAHIQYMVDKMSARLAPGSLRTYLANGRTMFAHAEEEEVIYQTPFRAIRLPKLEEPERLTWSPLQMRLFLQKTKGHRHGPLWAFMIATGRRVGEAIGLKPDAVDLDNGTVSIHRTEAVDGEGRRHVMDRTKSGTRRTHLIRLEPWIVDILRALPKGEYVFLVDGRRVRYAMLQADFYSVRDDLSLPEITLHGLRHSVASMMSAAGVDVAIIKSIVGHTNIQTTANTYIHTSTEGQQIGTQAAAKLLGFASSSATTCDAEQGESTPTASKTRHN